MKTVRRGLKAQTVFNGREMNVQCQSKVQKQQCSTTPGWMEVQSKQCWRGWTDGPLKGVEEEKKNVFVSARDRDGEGKKKQDVDQDVDDGEW